MGRDRWVPYWCPVCAKLVKCGYRLLVGPTQRVPICTHNEPEKDKCHDEPVRMEPVHG